MNKKGFTLIELVMIIVILGILAAVAIPRYADLSNDAKIAVLDGSIAAAKSAGVIEFARTKGPNPAATIWAATELENVTLSGSCASALATYSGGSPTKGFSLSTTYCSG